jgi:hypothetical protein
MSQFSKDDAKGREVFDAFCKQEKEWCKVNKFAKDDYSHWDVSFYSGKTANIGEIKLRKYKSNDYGTWYLQVDKYDALVQLQSELKAKGKDTRIAYINIFQDNITQIWVLDNIDMSKLEKKMIQLQKNDYEDELVWKQVYALPRMYGDPYETDLNKSIFNN